MANRDDVVIVLRKWWGSGWNSLTIDEVADQICERDSDRLAVFDVIRENETLTRQQEKILELHTPLRITAKWIICRECSYFGGGGRAAANYVAYPCPTASLLGVANSF